jgi:predicted ATPase
MLQPASRQLFGRDRELAVLLRALADSEGGRARVVWIGGEPGIGKTRLAEELAAAASGRATVAWGRCVDADAAPPYWPWAEAIRALLRTITLEELALTVSCLERIGALVPDLVRHPATTARPAALQTASDRYQLFDAVRTLFQRASSRAPLVVILDDLHQADAGSLLLLEFVARELSEQPAAPRRDVSRRRNVNAPDRDDGRAGACRSAEGGPEGTRVGGDRSVAETPLR